MKCPRCGLIVTDRVATCRGCGFSVADLDRKLRHLPARVGLVNDFAGFLPAEEKARLEGPSSSYNTSSTASSC